MATVRKQPEAEQAKTALNIYQKLHLAKQSMGKVIKNATNQYRQDEDLLHDYLEACCVIGPTAEAFSSELYQAFVKWFDKAIGGKRVPSHKRFSSLLNAREQFDTKKTAGKIKYLGIGINAESAFLQDDN